MSSMKRCLHLIDEFQPPSKKLVSNADLYIKELAQKQQNTIVNLQCELANPKEFCKGVELISLANYNAGSSTLKEFKMTIIHFDNIASLKAAGLREDEIKLYLDYQKGDDYFYNNHKNYEELTLKKTINRIENVVLKYEEQQSTFKETTLQSSGNERLDVGLSIKPSSDATKLYKFALENERLKKPSGISNPMDNIKQIEENFIKSLNVEKLPNINQIRRKARKLFNRVHCTNEVNSCPSSSKDSNPIMATKNPYVSKSKWDDKTETIVPDTVKQKQLYTCLPQNYYTIKDGEIVKLNKVECQARDLPLAQKLTIDEIKQIPKFQNYEQGIPSKVLYLRNLSNSVKESDLEGLFKTYDGNGNVTYKVMKGKMRGQAFVTFADENVALQALENVNGLFLKNKPVIIQFGCGKG